MDHLVATRMCGVANLDPVLPGEEDHVLGVVGGEIGLQVALGREAQVRVGTSWVVRAMSPSVASCSRHRPSAVSIDGAA